MSASGALPFLQELEALVVTDPFAGLDQAAANEQARQLHVLRYRVTHELDAAPQDDPAVPALVRRLEATDVKIAVADAAWVRTGLHAEVRHFWSMIQQEIAGWASETSDAGLLAAPELPRTHLAIQRVAYLLADPKTHQTRDDNLGDPVVESTYREADEVLAAAGAKMAAAYAAVLDEASLSPVPAPENTFELDKPRLLAGAAEHALAGTPHRDAVVARARALDARWQAEVTAVRQARQDLYDKLAVEADAAWPAIVTATGATEDVDLTDVGRVILIRGHNRAGTEFHADDFPFALRLHGTPVGGVYAQHVLDALEHARYTLNLDLNDRIAWDVIGIIEGRGKIGAKLVRVVYSADTHQAMGKVEQWPAVDCVRLRIIALHAGPVAVGP